MKYCITAMFSIVTLSSIAQDTTTVFPSHKKNGVGFIAEPTYYNPNDQSGIGIQYKRWVRHNRAIRINATKNNWYSYGNYEPVNIAGNVLYEQNRSTSIDMYSLGLGVEIHKQFYRKVYLYAAMEILGSYGTGSYYNGKKSTEYLPDGTQLITYSLFNPTYPVSRFTLSTVPFIGVKFLFKRISIGTELSAIQTGIVSMKYSLPIDISNTYFDVTMGQFRQRFYVNFRF